MSDITIEITTDIEGLDALEAVLTEGSKRMAKRFLGRVQTRAADVLVDGLAEHAPYAEGVLSDDIHKSTTTNSDGMLTRVGPGREGFYGIFQEFGAPEAHVPALHWAEEAAKSKQDEVLAEYIAAVDDGLEEMKP